MMYELGQGIPVNKEKAQYFCELAAEQGNVATQRVLISSFRKKDL
jgi:TPR repeat protein